MGQPWVVLSLRDVDDQLVVAIHAIIAAAVAAVAEEAPWDGLGHRAGGFGGGRGGGNGTPPNSTGGRKRQRGGGGGRELRGGKG